MTWLLSLVAGCVVVATAVRLRPGRAHADRAADPRDRSRHARPLRLAGVVAMAVASVATFGVGGLVVLALAAVAGAKLLGARRQRRAVRARDRAVPELVELFVVAASAGLPVASSLVAVSERAPGAVRPAVVAAGRRFERGLPLVECLGELGTDLGPAAEPLVSALTESVVSGTPLVTRLAGVSARARDARRQQALAAARRLPVTMLFPLVGCILPAAVVLAVVPVVLVSLSTLAR